MKAFSRDITFSLATFIVFQFFCGNYVERATILRFIGLKNTKVSREFIQMVWLQDFLLARILFLANFQCFNWGLQVFLMGWQRVFDLF